MDKNELEIKKELGKTIHILLGCSIIMEVSSYIMGWSINDMNLTVDLLNYLIPCTVLLAIMDTYYKRRIKRRSPKPKIAEGKE